MVSAIGGPGGFCLFFIVVGSMPLGKIDAGTKPLDNSCWQVLVRLFFSVAGSS